MHWQLVQDYELRLRKEEFKPVPEPVQQHAQETNSGFMQTGTTEGAMHCMKAFARSIAPQSQPAHSSIRSR